MKRTIITIDEAACTGCGLCAALQFLSCLFGGRGCPVILCC